MALTEAISAGVRHITVGAGESGQRIDNFLLRELKGVPRSHVYRLLRRGEVRVNGRRAKAEQRLEDGDAVVEAFAAIGWGWGGDWFSLKDFQHFSVNGR